MKESEKKVISILVDNKPNALARIASLVGRRNYNISTITASETHMSGTTLITIVVNSTDSSTLEQILAQIEKLEVVQDAHVIDGSNGLYRELLLLKVSVNESRRTSLREIVDIYRAKIIDLSRDSMIIELTGAPER